MEKSLPCVAATIALIYRTFDGVTREGGVSWSEGIAMDLHNTEAQWAAAKLLDTETRWQDLVPTEAWNMNRGIGGFTFLDAIGFRYYIAPAMIKTLSEGGADYLDSSLTLGRIFFRKISLEQWSHFNRAEIQCICEFLKCMTRFDDVNEAYTPEWGPSPWLVAYRSHWVNFDENPM